MDLNEQAGAFKEEIERLHEQFNTVIIGNRDIFDYILKALFTGGHILIEGLPGLGKTLIVKTVARLLGLDFARIQFTPDLMPADIVGVNILVETEDGHRRFHFEKGPVFTNILLADEINRASPKTQSALLQVMEEKEVTIFGADHVLDDIFLALATQNPIELKGTFPLPEAQLDRFMFKLSIPYPNLKELGEIARLNIETMGTARIPSTVMQKGRIGEIRDFVRQKIPSDELYRLASSLVFATNPGGEKPPDITRKYIKYGSSPRGLISLLAAAKISAFLDGRFNLAYEDLKENYLACLRHRIILHLEAQIQKIKVDEILADIFEKLERPS